MVLIQSLDTPESFSRIFLPSLSKFFYEGGGVATTRFSKPWPCAEILLGATLLLWRRVHCERVRVVPCTFCCVHVAGCGDRACLSVPAGVPRIGIGACCVHAWRTCVSRGRLRGSGVPRACRGGMPPRRVVGIGVGACCVHA